MGAVWLSWVRDINLWSMTLIVLEGTRQAAKEGNWPEVVSSCEAYEPQPIPAKGDDESWRSSLPPIWSPRLVIQYQTVSPEVMYI